MVLINPWIIYLMGLVNKANVVLAFVSVGSAIGFIFTGLGVIIEHTDESNPFFVRLKELTMKFAIATVISSILLVIIPNQSTLIKMVIAKNVTIDRVQVAADVVEKIYSDVMNILKK